MPPGASQSLMLELIIRARNEATAALRGAASDVSGIQATMASAGRAMLVSGAALGTAVAAGLAATVGPAMEFDQTMSGVQAVTAATAAQMDQLRATALQLGKATVFSSSQAAQAIEELAKGGVSTTDILNGAAAATVNLAAAGQVSLPQAATIAANAMNIFSLSGQQMAHTADIIAGAANASSLEVSDFAYSLQYAGTFARAAGITFDDLAVAIAELGQQGITGSAAGTQLADFLAGLQPRAGTALKAMEQLGLVTKQGGNAFVDAGGHIKNLATISQILQTATAGLTDAQRAHALQVIFGMQGQQAANILLREGAAGYERMAAAMGKVTATGVANARLDNLAGDLTNLSGSFETLRIQLGEGFGGGAGMPVFRQMAQNINGIVGAMIDWTKAHGPLLARLLPLIATVGGVTAAVLTLGGAFALIAAALSPVSVALAALVVVVGGLGAAWVAGMATMERSGRTTGDLLTAQATRWAATLSGWVDAAWTAMQPALSALGTQITGWLNTTADAITAGGQAWAQHLVGGMNVPPGSMDAALQSIVDGMDAWIQGDGVNAAIRLGNSVADAIVAAIVAKVHATVGSGSWWAGLLTLGTTTAPFQPTGGGLLGAIAPDIGKYTTAPFAPGGALSNQVPTAPGANAVPYGARAVIPGAADNWRQFPGGPDTWQKWAPPPGPQGPAPLAFAAIGREVAAMEGAAGRVAQAAARSAAQASTQRLEDAIAATARAGNPLTGAFAQQAAQRAIAPTTLGTGSQQPSAGSTQLLGGGGTTVNITVSVGTGAVQVQQGAGPQAEAQTRDYGLKIGEKIADALAQFARAERAVISPPRPHAGGARG